VVLSLASAHRLIAQCANATASAELATAFGFAGSPAPLAPADAAAIGIPPCARSVRVARGDGTLRVLIARIAPGTSAPDAVVLIARGLASSVPHLLWLIVARQPDSASLAVGAWRLTAHGPRVSLLLTQAATATDSDAEVLCALASTASAPGPDASRHARWLDVLGRDAITRRFFRALRGVADGLARSLTPTPPSEDAAHLALLCVSRLLFLAFLESRGWLDGDYGFLANGYARAASAGRSYQRSVLDPLLFGTLNTPLRRRAPRARAFGRVPFLNGGLFTRTPLEHRCRSARFGDDALAAVFDDLLTRYRFTPDESRTAWNDSAVDPEILGRAFESLMNADDRRRAGVYYTPAHLVERMTEAALAAALALPGDSATGGELAGLDGADRTRVRDRLATLRLLDPACGSGAFLVHALHRLRSLRAALGDPRDPHEIGVEVLSRSLFGVDVSPTAVWLCHLRLWLAIALSAPHDDPMKVPPLPNLDRQIRVGDALAAECTDDDRRTAAPRQLITLRRRYACATGARKSTLSRQLDRMERARAIAAAARQLARITAARRELSVAMRTPDLFGARSRLTARQRELARALRLERIATQRALTSLRAGGALPFTFDVHFAGPDTHAFDIVIGNPPWVRPHNVPPATRAALRERFTLAARPAWERGASLAGAGAGFAGQVDLAALFVERAVDLLAPGGTAALLVPAKLFHSLAGGSVRALLMARTALLHVEDCSGAPSAFDAATYPAIIVAARRHGTGPPASTHTAGESARETPTSMTRTGVTRGATAVRWSVPVTALPLDESPGAPWLLLPPTVRRAFDSLRDAGPPLATALPGRPLLGVKSGLNAAFAVRVMPSVGRVGTVPLHAVPVENSQRRGECEAGLLRPLVRGETLTPWSLPGSGTERIIWTHDTAGSPLHVLPPHARRWLAPYRAALERRSDARHGAPWWSLFRTESADCSLPRVMWSDLARQLRAAFLPRDDATVPLNTCYVLRCSADEDALALTALFNSALASAWLTQLAEPARGRYSRFLGWTVALLPIPEDWPRARTLLAPLARAAIRGDVPPAHALHHTVLQAYGLANGTVAPLLEWGAP